MAQPRIKVAPRIVAYTDANYTKLTAEIALPGVPIESVDLKLDENGMYLSAPARDVEYVAALTFASPVNKRKAQASYENGLLMVEVPFKDPMEDTIQVPVKPVLLGTTPTAALELGSTPK